MRPFPGRLTHRFATPHSRTALKLRSRRITTTPTMASAIQPVFASGYDPAQGATDLDGILKSKGEGEGEGEGKGAAGKWSLVQNGRGVERSFRFKGFKKTWEFMNVVAEESKVRKHHPEWSNVYNTAFIRWTTHSPPGLSEKDIQMARFCDEQARAFGEVESESESGSGNQEGGGGGGGGGAGQLGRELADRVAHEGWDCCVPKNQSKRKVDVGGC